MSEDNTRGNRKNRLEIVFFHLIFMVVLFEEKPSLPAKRVDVLCLAVIIDIIDRKVVE